MTAAVLPWVAVAILAVAIVLAALAARARTVAA